MAKIRGIWQQWRRQGFWKLLLAALWLLAVSSATGFDLRLVRFWERQFQTLFFEMRGPVLAPDDIVILAIDNESLNQAEHYFSDPEQYAELAPIQQFPWERRAYAIAIERLLEAGAKAVAIDLLLISPSTYGPEDDQALAAVLE
ncbi:protein kinase, partial [filamentous cyanobacterium CCP5]